MVDAPHEWNKEKKMCNDVVKFVRRHLCSLFGRSLQCQKFVTVKGKAVTSCFPSGQRQSAL